MPDKSYDLFANGLDQVIADLQKYENDLRIANDEFTERLATETIATIQALAMSNDPFEVMDIRNENVKIRIANGEISKIDVVNTSQNATYSEFGYGIVGKQSGIDTRPFEPNLNWEYDVKNHGDKGWWYRNRFGWREHSNGQIPRRTIYRSYLSVLGQVGSYAQSVFNKIRLGG